MKKLNTSPISGTQELLPTQQAIFNKLKKQIEEVYHLHGYQNIETPIIDRTEILLAKAGGDTEKQIYKVIKTTETADNITEALRFDHTVPLARYIVEHENDLIFPFKVSQIGRNFRGERAQKGRFREFYQCDVDVVGRGNLPVAYDADIIITLYEALRTFNLPEMRIRISNRKILSGLLAALNLSEKSEDIFSIIDHAEKVPAEKTRTNLEELGLSQDQLGLIIEFMYISGSKDCVMRDLSNLGIKNEMMDQGINELSEVLDLLAASGLGKNAIADMLIVRGLDYYTGTVFETFLPEYAAIGSICSGGRYDNLATHYTDQSLPGVGGSIGLTRLFYVLNEYNLIDHKTRQPIDISIIPITKNEEDYAFSVACELREKGYSTDVVMTDKKLGDKLTYAAKTANSAIIIGEAEVATKNPKVKDLYTGDITPLKDFLTLTS